jgi:hypothetical protein
VIYDCFVDPEGNVLPAHIYLLARKLGYRQPDFDLRGYAIRNLGWIWIRRRPGLMRIALRPLGFSRATFEAAMRLMIEEDEDSRFRFVFDRHDDSQMIDVLSNANDAIAHFEDLMSFAGESSYRATYFSEELSLTRLRHPKRRVLQDLIKNWKRMRGELSPDEVLEPFRAVGSNERFVVARSSKSRGTIAHFGTGITVFGQNWNDSVAGRELEEQPDRNYGESSAKAYHEVHHAKRPRLELVDALIRPPGQTVQRCRYDRLLLPWRSGNGTTFVSSTSVLRTRFLFPAAET